MMSIYAPVPLSFIAVLVALLVDQRLGEPGVRWHPVVWMGRYLTQAGNWLQSHTRQLPAPQTAPANALAAQCDSKALESDSKALERDGKAWALGAAVWLVGALAVFVLAAWVEFAILLFLPWWAAAVLLGLLLKPMLAWAMLKREVRAVEDALGDSLQAGRERLRFLVSRDVSALTATEVRESGIETLAENFNDSVVAPLFWFALLGLPGAAMYRFANTADAMWGYPGNYQGRNWAWAGKWAARADDVLNWIPARLSAVLLLLAGGPQCWQRLRGLRGLRQQAGRTPSPNSGWPMAAMALVLDVVLRKPGVYVLNAVGHAVQPQHLPLAIRCANRALLCWLLALAVGWLVTYAGYVLAKVAV